MNPSTTALRRRSPSPFRGGKSPHLRKNRPFQGRQVHHRKQIDLGNIKKVFGIKPFFLKKGLVGFGAKPQQGLGQSPNRAKPDKAAK